MMKLYPDYRITFFVVLVFLFLSASKDLIVSLLLASVIGTAILFLAPFVDPL
jgi:hypothetical protein